MEAFPDKFNRGGKVPLKCGQYSALGQCLKLNKTEKNGGSHVDTRIHLCLPFDCICKVSNCLVFLPPWHPRRPWWAFSSNCGPKQTLPSSFVSIILAPTATARLQLLKFRLEKRESLLFQLIFPCGLRLFHRAAFGQQSTKEETSASFPLSVTGDRRSI